jgi:hypothetical protein
MVLLCPSQATKYLFHKSELNRGVPQWVLDVNVSVQRDGAQIKNGRSGAHNVESDPRVAKLGPEYPVAQ